MEAVRAAALIAALGAGLAIGTAEGQEPAPERSRFVQFVEGLLSTEDRQVQIIGISGTFSANPTVQRLTVADPQGVWLELRDVEVSWTRTALFRRVLDIQSLEAAEVHVFRKPSSATTDQVEETAGGFSLPVDIAIDSFSFPDITLDEPVAGIAANLNANGSVQIDEEAIATELNLERLDAPGGSLAADLRLQPAQNLLTADLRLSEPAGGLVSDLLGIPGRPALEVALDGTGPLGDWNGDLNVNAAGAEVLAGTVAIAGVEDGFRFSGDLAGTLTPVVPPDYSALVAGRSTLTFDLVRSNAGALSIANARLASEGTEITARGELGTDLVPQSGMLSARIGQAGRTVLPLVPGEVSIASLVVNATLEEGANAAWTAEIAADEIASAQGNVGALRLNASGEAANIGDADDRVTTFRLEGTGSGIALNDPELRGALGDNAQVNAAGLWSSGEPTAIENLQLVLDGATASFSGTVSGEAINGEYSASATDLARFASLAGRPLAGRAAANLSGRIDPATANFDLMANAVAVDLEIGIAAADGLLRGESHLTGGVARSDGAIRFNELRVETPQAIATVNGSYADPEIDLDVRADIADVSAVSERASGGIALEASLAGTLEAPQVNAQATGDELVLMGRPFTDARATFEGVVAGPETNGRASLSGRLGDVPVEGSAELAAGDNGTRLLRDLLVSVGESRATGNLMIGANNLLDGDLAVVSPDLSAVAPLFLVEARGSLQAGINFSSEGGGQNARFAGTANDVVYEAIEVGAAEISGNAADLFSAPKIDGRFEVRDLTAGGLEVVRATGTASRQGEATGFNVEAGLADGSASLVGTLAPRGEALELALDRFSFNRAGAALALASPATILIENGTAAIDNAVLTVNGGRIEVDGRAGSELALSIALADVPAALIDSFAPTLDPEGAISGTAQVTGSASDPQAEFDLSWQGASLEATRNAGLGALGIDAEGTYGDGAVALTSQISGADGLAVTVGGSVQTGGGGNLDLDVDGTVPLSLGNIQLAERGAALSGALTLDISVTGPSSSPEYSGTISSEGGGFVDPETGIVLTDLSLGASLSGNQIVIDRLTARSGGGTVTASGSVGLDPAAGLPVDLSIVVRGARYVDGTLLAATFDADLAITGGLTAGPVIEGTVDVDRAEITVPERLPQGSIAVEVMHLYEPAPVAATIAKAEYGERGSADAGGGEPSGVVLDVLIRAPDEIFVRGRGLDSELGGELSLQGPVSSIVAAGAFEMRRGRFDIFTQRITFDRGIVTFAGDLDPILDFSGTTTSGEVTITVNVTGQASDPEVRFSSVPELPEDEVLAYLLFNRSLAELSPFQLARLAAAVAQFAGGSSGGGLLDQLRQATGFDDLDIVTDETGGAAVQAGRYIGENLYLNVQQGIEAGDTRVNIELQITEEVKARAGVSAQGGTSLGVFYEREY